MVRRKPPALAAGGAVGDRAGSRPELGAVIYCELTTRTRRSLRAATR